MHPPCVRNFKRRKFNEVGYDDDDDVDDDDDDVDDDDDDDDDVLCGLWCDNDDDYDEGIKYTGLSLTVVVITTHNEFRGTTYADIVNAGM